MNWVGRSAFDLQLWCFKLSDFWDFVDRLILSTCDLRLYLKGLCELKVDFGLCFFTVLWSFEAVFTFRAEFKDFSIVLTLFKILKS